MGSLETAGMTTGGVRGLLASVASGRLSVQEAEARLAHLPFEDLGFARVDHHRTVRGAGPEVVYARSKTPEQVAATIRSAMPFVPPERLYPCTNCGMVPLGRDVARGKLRALAAGAAIVRREVGAGA